jgi:hypothetical protein
MPARTLEKTWHRSSLILARYFLPLMGLALMLSFRRRRVQWTIALPFTKEARRIHSHDLMDRPNRPLHIYGNIVRWLKS